MTASHSGEDFHLKAVDGLLERAQVSKAALQCGCHVPYHFEAQGRVPAPALSFDARHHNCSGKHAGFLAYCHLHGLTRHDYLDAGHPLQRRIRQQVGALLDRSPESIASGIDGCSAPNLALPLSDLARLWAMLATAGQDVPAPSNTPEVSRALGEMFKAMTTHPEYVSGTDRTDLHLAQAGAGDWVAKAGADGVQTLAIRSQGLGIALKISDGHADARHIAMVEVLRQLGLPGAEHPVLDRYRRMVIRNIAGHAVGERLPVFELSRFHS